MTETRLVPLESERLTVWRAYLLELDQGLRVALAFLTRLPVVPRRPWQSTDLAAATPYFPLVGALVGCIGALFFAAASFLALPSLPAALLALVGMIFLTGALHEDGLADMADGFGGGSDRD